MHILFTAQGVNSMQLTTAHACIPFLACYRNDTCDVPSHKTEQQKKYCVTDKSKVCNPIPRYVYIYNASPT